VQVITHNTPAMKKQPSIFLAMFDTVQNNIPVSLPRKNIYPFHDSKNDKMYGSLVSDFITSFVHIFLFIKKNGFR
jgi:hypothetical protein